MQTIRLENAKGPADDRRRRRVLAIVGDTQVGLWVTRSLGRGGLKVFCLCASPRGLAAHSRYSAGAWTIAAPPDDPAFIGQVESLARRLNVASVMTIAEPYHWALIRGRHRLEPDVHVFAPVAEAFNKATDKDTMHALARRLGVPVARGMTLDRFMAGSDSDLLRFPLVLRTRNLYSNEGRAPWKAAYAETERELRMLHEQVGPIASNILVQEYHPGVEDHIQILMQDGRPFMVGEYIGEHHMPLAGGVTVQRVTCRHEGIVRDAVRLLQAIGWEGVAGVQFHYDPETGRYIFLEINPRFIGGLPTVIMAGFDAPFLLWQSHFEPEKMRKTRYRLGVRTRVLGGDANWVLGMLRGDPLPPGQRRLGRLEAVSEFLWHFGPWTRDDVAGLGDLKPAWIDWMQMIRRLRSRSVDLIGNPEPTAEP